MAGEIGILNVGAGDTKISFDKNNPAELARSARIVRDMLRRGYALLVEVTAPDGSKSYTRVYDFIEDTAEYVIADLDPTIAAREDTKDDLQVEPPPEASPEPAAKGHKGPGRGNRSAQPGRGKRKIYASETTGVAVARSAGG